MHIVDSTGAGASECEDRALRATAAQGMPRGIEKDTLLWMHKQMEQKPITHTAERTCPLK